MSEPQYGEPWRRTKHVGQIATNHGFSHITVSDAWSSQIDRITECVNLLAGVPESDFDQIRHFIKTLKGQENAQV